MYAAHTGASGVDVSHCARIAVAEQLSAQCSVVATVVPLYIRGTCNSHSHPSSFAVAALSSAMDERISLTRHVAARMLATKPWRALLHSTASRAVAAQRLHNILALFPELLRLPKHRDQLYSLVDVIAASLLPALPTTATADVSGATLSSTSPLLFQLYVAALALRVSQLLPSFTPSQQLHVAMSLQPHADRYKPLIEASLLHVRSAFLSERPFSELQLAPHHLTFATARHYQSALHPSRSDKTLTTSSSPPPSPSAPVSVPLSHLPRLPCPRCSTGQPFYCTRCYCLVHPLASSAVPRVSLPFQLHIVVHPRFDRSKSTALHCRLLCAGDDVAVHEWPHTPPWSDADAPYVMWPDEHAVDVAHLTTSDNTTPPTRRPCVVLLEGTWEQAAAMRRSKRLAHLPSVRLSDARTRFWRWQDRGASHLSSVEAVYQTAVQWQAAEQTRTPHEFNNLLWLFALGWTRVRDYYALHPQLLPPVSHSGYHAAAAAVPF